MADFCNQCANELGFTTDFKSPDDKKGVYSTVLCEGCGPCQVNNKGECISDDCLVPGHNVPLDKDVTYITYNPDFTFGEVSQDQIGYGEWSSSMDNLYIHIQSIDDIPHIAGYKVYVCSEGTYTLHALN